ncbi:MAG TPA: inositol monophosphatase family protein [Streptosporangiaceae bacterium]|jgi:myo-inositol-1(or 4)-monophosphatase
MTAPGELLDLARQAAAAAGRLLAERRPAAGPAVVATKSSPTDVVTEMDQAAERLIRKMITAVRPGDAILGEEGGETGKGAPVRWVVDPLDGTVNYLYGLPDWAVSVAAESGGEIVAGAVVLPRRGEEFSAVRGGGAWLRAAGAPPAALRCNDPVSLDRALVATGFGYESRQRRVQGQVVSAVLPAVRDIRRGGSCAVDLCTLAAGGVDGYYERGVNYWDTAAGALIAREAGALVGGLRGRPPGRAMTMAAGPALFGPLHDLLAGLDPERD